jgi:nickel-dependent lactate racemase
VTVSTAIGPRGNTSVCGHLVNAPYNRVMRVRLDYGVEGLEVDLPDDDVTVVEPIFRSPVRDPHAALIDALRAPIAGPPLREVVRRGGRIAISVCDVTRAQPRRETLQALFEEMPNVAADDITILIATGTHRSNTPAEIEAMVGRDILRRYRVINHDSRDPSALVHVGDTTTGAPVHLNRVWVSADLRITTGFVEPHFFAGFSGRAGWVTDGARAA